MQIAPRITAEADKMGGKPCIRGLRFPVRDLLGLLAAGMTIDEILEDYPWLEAEDVPAALAYAASQDRLVERGGRVVGGPGGRHRARWLSTPLNPV